MFQFPSLWILSKQIPSAGRIPGICPKYIIQFAGNISVGMSGGLFHKCTGIYTRKHRCTKRWFIHVVPIDISGCTKCHGLCSHTRRFKGQDNRGVCVCCVTLNSKYMYFWNSTHRIWTRMWKKILAYPWCCIVSENLVPKYFCWQTVNSILPTKSWRTWWTSHTVQNRTNRIGTGPHILTLLLSTPRNRCSSAKVQFFDRSTLQLALCALVRIWAHCTRDTCIPVDRAMYSHRCSAPKVRMCCTWAITYSATF